MYTGKQKTWAKWGFGLYVATIAGTTRRQYSEKIYAISKSHVYTMTQKTLRRVRVE